MSSSGDPGRKAPSRWTARTETHFSVSRVILASQMSVISNMAAASLKVKEKVKKQIKRRNLLTEFSGITPELLPSRQQGLLQLRQLPSQRPGLLSVHQQQHQLARMCHSQSLQRCHQLERTGTSLQPSIMGSLPSTPQHLPLTNHRTVTLPHCRTYPARCPIWTDLSPPRPERQVRKRKQKMTGPVTRLGPGHSGCK